MYTTLGQFSFLLKKKKKILPDPWEYYVRNYGIRVQLPFFFFSFGVGDQIQDLMPRFVSTTEPHSHPLIFVVY
jgi:hypothetical protein